MKHSSFIRSCVLVLFLVRAGTVLVLAQTQEDVQEEIELTRTAIQTDRQAIVTRVMSLSGSQAEAFWPLYLKYRQEVTQIGDERVALITDFANNFETMTDAKAKELLDKSLALEKATLDLKNKYVVEFRKVFSEKQLARYFQVENKLDAILMYDLAGSIPLVQ